MLLKLFLVSVLLFAFCDGTTLELTDDMMRSLSPESEFASKAIRQLSSKQQSEYMTFFMERFEKMTSPHADYEHEEKKLMEELKVAYPDIHKKIASAEEKYKQRLAEMSQPAQDFFEFYKNHKRGMLKKLGSLEESLGTAICDSLTKWNALDTETKDEIKDKFPKFHNTFESHQFQTIDCQSTVSFVPPAEEDDSFQFA